MQGRSSYKTRKPRPTGLVATSTTTRQSCPGASQSPMIPCFPRGQRPMPDRSTSERRNLRPIHAAREITDEGLVFTPAATSTLADGDHGARHAVHRCDNGVDTQAELPYLDRNPQAARHGNSRAGALACWTTLNARHATFAERSAITSGRRRQALTHGTLCALDRDAADRLGYAFRGRLSDRSPWFLPLASYPAPRR